MNTRGWIYVDFESYPIRPRPAYPPKPVGAAIRWPGRKTKYYSFAHPRGCNTHTEAQVRAELLRVWKSGAPVCFHNAKFDLCVAYEHFKLPVLDWTRVHDTMLMLFLRDPRAKHFKLKPNSEALLGAAPTQRDEVLNWLVKQQPVPGVRLVFTEKPKKSKKTKDRTPVEYAGAYTAYAPVELVEPYACSDVDRTEGLATLLMKELTTRKMIAAYNRERHLLEPILVMEHDGVPVNVKRLKADVAALTLAEYKVDDWLRRITKAPKDTNWDSRGELSKWLMRAGFADPEKMGLTKKGKTATNKAAMARGVSDQQVLAILRYRSRLCVSLRTFMRPWLAVAEKSGGFIFTTWHTTRTDDTGARTGRLSSTPNFQNLTKKPVKLWGDKPAPAWWRRLDLPELPNVRAYLIPRKGHVLVDRDYSQQELRILAHYVEGELLRLYQADPWLDVHALIQATVQTLLAREVARDLIKPIVFGIIYGMGATGFEILGRAFGCSKEDVLEIAFAVRKTVPGLEDLNHELRHMVRSGLPIRTWGGRQYFVEDPRIVDGKMRTFEYKMLNLLIQGSAGDDTKQATINLWEWMKKNGKAGVWFILLTVHDEFVLSVPRAEAALAHKVLNDCMADVKFDLEMKSEGKTGEDWGSLKTWDKKGERVAACR